MRYGLGLGLDAVLQMEMGQMCFNNVLWNGYHQIKNKQMHMEDMQMLWEMAGAPMIRHQARQFVKVSIKN